MDAWCPSPRRSPSANRESPTNRRPNRHPSQELRLMTRNAKEAALALYDVKALALKPRTGSIVGGPRVERIDTDTNELFSPCSSEWEVEDTYEAFWNRLNHSWELHFPKDQDKVKVLMVTRVVIS